MSYKILLLEPLAQSGLDVLYDAEEVEYIKADSDFNKEEVYGLIARGKIGVTSAMIDEMPNLRVISKCGTGLDTIDTAHASKKGIAIFNTPGINADSVAEHTLSFILSLQRKIYQAASEVRKGNWQFRTAYDGDEIRDKTLGIIGMGDIGQKVAHLCQCFGMKVQYWNRSDKHNNFSYVGLDQLFETSDIISIHVALTEDTKSLINKEALARMKSDVILINTARAGIVDEEALVTELKNGKVGAYAVDVPRNVFPDENHPLNQFDQVIMTPHTASLTKRTFNEICKTAALNIVNFVKSQH